MLRHKNAFGETLHDFTVRARAVVEETIERKLPGPMAGLRPQNPTEAIIAAIVARHNIRSTVRLTGIPQNRVKEIAVETGESCQRIHKVSTQKPSCVELHCAAQLVLQEKNRREMADRKRLLSVGSAWSWTSIDPDTRFVPHWLVAPYNVATAEIFLKELDFYKPAQARFRISGRSQFEWFPNGHGGCSTVADALRHALETRVCDETREVADELARDQWLAILSEGLVRKIRRHSAILSLLFTYHNFVSIDPSTKTSPAVTAGISDHVWSLTEMIELLN